ncbi:peptidoglycan recognition protein [Plakobranchus ocellatus]|uniref:Peptidoglycan recognition protein n=1 Tax=Plakobranchus ocellatus TaxID=259542 RepID=A0AAV4DJ97_9GAST|nr:peptidoglycan recognition protein [Plakobranchus ocellatus]
MQKPLLDLSVKSVRADVYTFLWFANTTDKSFCLIGNFMTKGPTEVQLNKTKQLLECGVLLSKLESEYTVRGHRDVRATLCPGDILYNIIRGWPEYH